MNTIEEVGIYVYLEKLHHYFKGSKHTYTLLFYLPSPKLKLLAAVVVVELLLYQRAVVAVVADQNQPRRFVAVAVGLYHAYHHHEEG